MQGRGIDELIAQLRATAALAAARPTETPPRGALGAPASGGFDFAATLRMALERVNATDQHAARLARDFELGNGDVPLHEVMVAMQKSNIAFQGTVQVRNRLVAAYQDIMNMQI